MGWRRHRNPKLTERQAQEDLVRWLAAEREADEAGAERALAALFTALPAIEPPRGVTQRVLSETVWSVEPEAVAAARGWWRAVAVLAGLAGVTLLAGGSLAPGLVGLLDPAAALAGALDSLLVVARVMGGWLGTAGHLLDVLPWLGSAILLVASSPQAVMATLVGAGLTALAIKVLHQVVERDRRLSYAEAN